MQTRRQIIKTLQSGLAIPVSVLITSTLAAPAYAHRQKLTLSDIRWVPTKPQKDKIYSLADRSGTMEITHSFHIHEAEIALSQTYGLINPDLTELETQARLALYVQNNFNLSQINETPIELELLGADQHRQTIYVYQQVSLTDRPEGLIIDCQLFRDLADPLINNVDIQLSKKLQSLQFKQAQGPKKVLA